MLGATSLLSGEYTPIVISQSRSRRSRSANAKRRLSRRRFASHITPSAEPHAHGESAVVPNATCTTNATAAIPVATDCSLSIKTVSHRRTDDSTATTMWNDGDDDDDEHDEHDEHDLQGDGTFSSNGGSTCLGDSFVLAIDWETTTGPGAAGPRYYHEVDHDGHRPGASWPDNRRTTMAPLHQVDVLVNNGLNDSLEDPYLPSLESMRQRLFQNSTTNTATTTLENSASGELRSKTLVPPSTPADGSHLLPSSSIRSVRKLLGGSSAPPKARQRSITTGQLLASESTKSAALQSPTSYNPNWMGVLEATSVSTTASAAKSLGSFAMPSAVLESQSSQNYATNEQTKTGLVVARRTLAVPSRSGLIESSHLGSFDFPPTGRSAAVTATATLTDDDDGFVTAVEDEDQRDGNPLLPAISLPRRARFDAPNLSLQLNISHTNSSDIDEDDDDDGVVDKSMDTNFVIPTMPVLTKAKYQPITPSRKRHYLARQQITLLKAELNVLRRRQVAATAATAVATATGGDVAFAAAAAQSPKRLQMAKIYLALGSLEQQLHQYPAAINSFFHAAAIYRHFDRPAALATALDYVAVAYCHAHEEGSTAMIHRQHKVNRFYRCLYEALELRKQELGPWHVDTVDTLQHLAQLLLLTGQAALAAGHYLEVVQLRKAIFGSHHAGTAVTAHCLGNAYVQSHDLVNAEIWYDYALGVYRDAMGLPEDNPAVVKLMRDRKRLERVDRWITEDDPADDENLLFEL